MKRKIALIIVWCVCTLFAVFGLAACGVSGGSSSGSESSSGSGTPEEGKNPSALEITGVEFSDKTAVYNGWDFTLEVTGTLPQGVTVSYENNTGRDAGVYNATATLSGEGYKTKKLNATLTVNKAVASKDGLTFETAVFDYDGKPHKIEVTGVAPQGGKFVYSCDEDEKITNSATAAGTYTVKAWLEHKNYEFDSPLTAKLIIKTTDKLRYITSNNGTLYFANALDKDRLYSYNASSGIKRISGDVPSGFASFGSTLYFQSDSVLFASIKSIDGANNINSIVPQRGEYLCTDGTHLYYAVNGLTGNGGGIYKVNPSASEPEAALLSQGKAEYLQYSNGYIFFADGTNGGKLSKISVNGNGARALVLDEKITCLTANDNSLYFTVNNLLGDYIARYDIQAGKTVKLTSDAGAALTVVGNDIYYVNVDLISSNLFGKGIYRTGANKSADVNLPGTKVIAKDNGKYSSLTLLSQNLIAYYRVDDQMLCTYDVTTGRETEILAGFTAPETVPLSLGSKTAYYGDKLFYLDLYNGKALYSYDTANGDFMRLTSCKVSDFAVIGDILYFNGVSYGVNNDLYKVSLKDGGEPEKISTYDCNDIVTDGNNIFYVEKNAAGVRTAVHIIKADGTDEIIYEKGVNCLTYYENFIYFVDGKDLLKMPVSGYVLNQTETVKKGNTDTFVINEGVIYFREMYGVGWALKRLSCINVDGTGYSVIYSENTDPLKIAVSGDKIYYYTDTVSGTSGIYVIDKNTRNESIRPTLLMNRNVKYYAGDFTVTDKKIYFVNYYNNLGDSHLYSINITGENQVPVRCD